MSSENARTSDWPANLFVLICLPGLMVLMIGAVLFGLAKRRDEPFPYVHIGG